MKNYSSKQISLWLTASAALAAPLTHAQESLVYSERFTNTTGANAEFTEFGYGWSAYSSVMANPVDLTPGAATIGGYSPDNRVQVSNDENDEGLVFVFSGPLSENVLLMSNQTLNLSTEEISAIEFYRLTSSSGWDWTVHVAAQVGGQWYANALAYPIEDPIPSSSTMYFKRFDWTNQDWIPINFDPEDTASLGLNVDAVGELPAGDLENFGFYMILSEEGGGALLDEVAVYAETGGGATWAGYPL